jgi:hypothetical protein
MRVYEVLALVSIPFYNFSNGPVFNIADVPRELRAFKSFCFIAAL